MPRIFNKGKRTITYGPDAANDKIGPQQQKDVSPEQAESIRSQWGHEVVNLDSKEEMQATFKPEEKKERSAGFISVEDAEKQKQEAVAEALRQAGNAKTGTANGEGNPPPVPPVSQSVEELAQELDTKDRPDLIAFIEAHELPVQHKKIKGLDDLKSAVFNAYKTKKENENASANAGTENATGAGTANSEPA